MEHTPMMQQYLALKEQYPDSVLFFRLGDFYEMFGDDARLASEHLDITLTTRDKNKDADQRVPMCGVPYHSYEAYVARLLEKGIKVALCDQLEEPTPGKLVPRDVVRVYTPGTVIDSSMLDDGKATYLAAVSLSGTRGAICFADLSTGEVAATSFTENAAEHLMYELGRISPAEAILDTGAAANAVLYRYFKQNKTCLSQTDEESFDLESAATRITEQFGQTSQELEIAEYPDVISALGALLSYLAATQKRELAHLNRLRYYTSGQYMELDLPTRRNLELTETLRHGEMRGSLLWVLDKTKTPMGKRLMRNWVARPLLDVVPIHERLAAVEELAQDTVTRGELQRSLRELGDMERLIGKAVYGSAGGRDLQLLGLSFALLPSIVELLARKNSLKLAAFAQIDLLGDIAERILQTICDEPPFSIREGNIIRAGFDAEIDRLRGLLTDSHTHLSRIEANERKRTGKRLKIGYNKVFGYYIEIPRTQSGDVPNDYIRKQTLTNAERFITEELKTLEAELLTAKEKLNALEYEAFATLRTEVAAAVTRVQATAAAVAELDVLTSFAEVAVRQNYVKPAVDLSSGIQIKDGRHPVVEIARRDSRFVPNDTDLDASAAAHTAARVMVITGPNMAGKSTYMRQTALIVLMAQIGSFVPAKSAQIGIVDRIFTRIGASDDLAAGQSTFMVEMTEVAGILKNATAKSLLILDEIGRGTSTYDGMSIARAVLEHTANPAILGAKTLFATHYHELTALQAEVPGIQNYNIAAKKREDNIIFLRKIVPGGTDDSYGIEVAKLAGTPDSVIIRAKEILQSMEKPTSEVFGQIPLFDDAPPAPETSAPNPALGQLQKLNLDTLTPIEAMNALFELKKMAND